MQCSIYRGGGGYGVQPPLVEDDPLLLSVKFGLGVGFDPQKGKKSKFVVNRYKLMSGIIQTQPQKLFVMVCRLTASPSPILLLCLITFKQYFNESMLFSLQLLCVCIIVKCRQSISNCRCQTAAMAAYTLLICSVLCTPQAYGSLRLQLIENDFSPITHAYCCSCETDASWY